MKRSIWFLTILGALCWTPAAAQQPFSIDAEDLRFEHEIGSHVMVSTTTVDPLSVPFGAGDWFVLQALADQTGDGQAWDLTPFMYESPSTIQYFIEAFDPSDTTNPGASIPAYQGANCYFWIPDHLNPGIGGDVYDYFFFGETPPFNYIQQHGNLQVGGPRTENTPPYRLYQFPLNLGDTNVSTFQRTVVGGPGGTASVTVTTEIDGRGLLTIPGRANVPALRIKETTEVSFAGGGTLTEMSANFITTVGVGAKLQHNMLPPPMDGWDLVSYRVDTYMDGEGMFCNQPVSRGVLFVVDDAANLNTADALARDLMMSLNLEVEIISDDIVTTQDANARELIVVSGSVDDEVMAVEWASEAVPLVSWEAGIYDILQMTGAILNTDFGLTGATNTLTLVDASHPIANGASGDFVVSDGAFAMNFGVPSNTARTVATADGGKATIFTYDTDAMLVDGSNVPARRVGFYMHPGGPDVATVDGMLLLEYAILWALGREADIAANVAIETRDDAVPDAFVLDQNYPNPFNPTTNIPFSVATAGPVSLAVFNVLGQEVAVLVDEPLAAGNYATDFRADGLPSGVYLYRLKAGATVVTRKMLLAK